LAVRSVTYCTTANQRWYDRQDRCVARIIDGLGL
jgi:hypothetical protein